MSRVATRSETVTVAKRIVRAFDLSPFGEYDDVRVISRRDYDGRTGYAIVCEYVDMVQVADMLRGTLKPGAWCEPINSALLAVYVD